MDPTSRRPLRPLGLLAVLWVVAAAACDDAPTGSSPPDGVVDLSRPWASSSAAAEGFDEALLEQAFDEAAGLPNLRALLVVRNGRMVREAYFNETDAATLLDVRSVTKTVTGLLVGLAVDDGVLDVDDGLGDWFPADSLRPAHAPIRVHHLLTMTSGMRWSDADDFIPWYLSGRPVGYVFDLPVVAEPGEAFIYNSGTSHLLGRIVAMATGRPLETYADERLLGPLGITARSWQTAGGQTSGAAGFALRARDLARLGQLVLQEGWSGSTEVVPASWMEQAFARRVELGPVGDVLRDGGYGYQVWTESGSPPALVMWGFGGQFVWVVPSRELVVVGAHHWLGADFDRSARQANALGALIREKVVAAARGASPFPSGH